MASLIQQRGLFYAQFFAKHQSPQRRQIPLHTRTKKTALILLRRLEDDCCASRGLAQRVAWFGTTYGQTRSSLNAHYEWV